MSVKRLAVIIFSSCLIGVSNANSSDEKICKNFPDLRPKTGVFMRMNCDFHNLYVSRLNTIKSTFGAPNGRPVILNLGGRLILKYNGQTQYIDITPDPYSQLMAFSRQLFSILFILATLNNTGEVYKNNKQDLVNMLRNLEESKQYLSTIAPGVTHDVNFIVRETRGFVRRLLANNTWSIEELKKYYSKINYRFKKILKYAASIEISSLDKALNAWLVGIPKEDQAKIGIVVAVVHQSRAQEISVNYFAKKFHRFVCDGSLCEDGLVIMEDKFDENSAYELLARHYIDRQAGEVIFNDPRRLQYDLLAQ